MRRKEEGEEMEEEERGWEPFEHRFAFLHHTGCREAWCGEWSHAE